MSNIKLREAFFRVEPIRNIVGSGDRMAFHIFMTKGDTVGLLGPVGKPGADASGNDSQFVTTAAAPGRRSRSWITRLLFAAQG